MTNQPTEKPKEEQNPSTREKSKTEHELEDTPLRYLAYLGRLRPLVTAGARYLAYTSDVGEAFRPVVPLSIVRSAYAISWLYCGGDVFVAGRTDYKDGKDNTEVTRTVVKRAIFQTAASMALPAFTIHETVKFSSKLYKKVGRFQKWGPTLTGLAVVPFLPFAFDKPVEHSLDWLFDKFGCSKNREVLVLKRTFPREYFSFLQQRIDHWMDHETESRSLPPECLSKIFCNLDFLSVCRVLQVCKQWNEIVKYSAVFKELCIRDFPYHINDKPYPDQEIDAVYIFDQAGLCRHEITVAPNPKTSDDESQQWQYNYKHFANSVNLTGQWTAMYGSHGQEIVSVKHEGFTVQAVKVTGDANVPAGKPTFNITLCKNLVFGHGKMHLAETGYIRPHWGSALLEIHSKDEFTVLWTVPSNFYFYPLYFKRKV